MLQRLSIKNKSSLQEESLHLSSSSWDFLDQSKKDQKTKSKIQ